MNVTNSMLLNNLLLRKLLHMLIVVAVIQQSVCARNRIASDNDRSIYGDYIIPGDLIIDTPTKQTPEGNELIYYFMAKQWPGLREGGTIWLDGERLGFLKVVKFCNTASAMNPWHVKSVTFKNIPTTQFTSATFFCQGLQDFVLNGESENYPGLASWPSTRKFLTGSFGFHITSKMFGGHGFNISVLDGGTVQMKGFEVQHGFSGVRIANGDHNIVIAGIDISNFYVHDTGDGEGFYIGATHKPPFAKISNLKIYNGVIVRTAAEALQLQHLIGGADIHNIVIRNADTRWMNEFRAGQDTGIQWSIDAGENKLHHIIVDGFGSVGLVPFGSDAKPVGGKSHVHDIFFNDGLDVGMYLHKSAAYGVHWIFENITYKNLNSYSNYYRTGRPERKYVVSSKNGTDKYTFKKIRHDKSRGKVFQDTARLEIGKIDAEDLPLPTYVNTGFKEQPSKIRQWHQYFAGYFPASQSGKVKIPTCWEAGEIAIETEGEYSFYKCITTHESTDLRPAQNLNFVKLTWDANGVRSDDPAWDSKTTQSNFPPDDVRLKNDCVWKKNGYGFEF
jgi:hypothetical protein